MQRNSCLFMQNIIEDIMDLSKIEFNKFEENPTLFSIKDAIEEVLELVEFQLESKKLKVKRIVSN